jgi:hypothetical protein
LEHRSINTLAEQRGRLCISTIPFWESSVSQPPGFFALHSRIMRNTSDSEPIQGIRLRKEVPIMGHFLDYYEKLSTQLNSGEKQPDGHLSRLSSIAPVDDLKMETVCQGMYLAAIRSMDSAEKKLIEIPDWIQCNEQTVIALDRLLFLLEFHRADRFLEVIYTLTNIIKLLAEMESGSEFQKDIEILHFLRLFLWDVMKIST